MTDERLIDLLLMQVGRGCAWKPPPKKKRRSWPVRAFRIACTVLFIVWEFVARRIRCAYRWIAWKTWERRAVERGRQRWRKLAGIGRPDGYSMRAERTGQIHVWR